MEVSRYRQSQGLLQGDLPRGTRQEVGAAHDVGDALFGIVDHRRQRVGVNAVSAAYDDIALRQRIEMALT